MSIFVSNWRPTFYLAWDIKIQFFNLKAQILSRKIHPSSKQQLIKIGLFLAAATHEKYPQMIHPIDPQKNTHQKSNSDNVLTWKTFTVNTEKHARHVAMNCVKNCAREFQLFFIYKNAKVVHNRGKDAFQDNMFHET